MTYTLFECLKDRMEELMADQRQSASEEESSEEEEDSDESDDSDVDVGNLSIGGKAPKKEQLTKAQKRRQWDQSIGGGERARGWNWVDIVKHLAQVGNKDQAGAAPKNYEG